MSRLSRRTGAGALLASAVGAFILIPGTAQGGVSGIGFTATAAADPFRVTTIITKAPGTKSPIDSGGPSAQAGLGTSGGGVAYSAAPTPGAFLAILPQLGSGLADQNGAKLPFAAPDYPFSVTANDQEPSKSLGSGGYSLAGDVTPSSSVAHTQTGGASPIGNFALVDALAQVTETVDGVQAKAVSDVQGITIGPLTIGSLRSVATVASDKSGSLTRNSSFAVDAMRIGTLPVGLAPGGFTVFGNPVPGDTQAIFNSLLEAGGVTLEQFPVRETENGIIGSGLVITHKFDGQSFGPTTVVYRFGGVAVDLIASAASPVVGAGSTAGAFGDSPATGVAPGVTDVTDGSAGVDGVAGLAGTAGLPGAASSNGAGAVPGIGSGVAGAAAGQSQGATAAGTSAAPGPAVIQLVPASAVRAPLAADGGGLYAAIALTGVLGFGVATFIRATR